MQDDRDGRPARILISPKFRFLGEIDNLLWLEEQIPIILTTGLAQASHIVVVAREDAHDLLSQTVNRIASGDYIEAHDGGRINIERHVHLDVSKEDIVELNEILEEDVTSRLMALGVDLVVYGKFFQTPPDKLRVDVYLLNVSASTLQDAEGMHTSEKTVFSDLSAVARRLASAVERYLDKRIGRQRRKSFAILPFRCISGDRKWDIWREGLTEELITVLKNAKALKLVERGATAKYKDRDDLDLAAVGRELNVNVVLWGSYDVFTDDTGAQRIVIRARLVEVQTGEYVETFKEEGKIDYTTQVKLAQRIMQSLDVQPTSVKELQAAPTGNLSALECVREGIHHFDARDFDRAINAFRAALRLDPEYSDAHFHLGLAHKELKSYDEALKELQSALGDAYDGAFGELLWTFRAGWKVWAKPATDQATLCIGAEDHILYALDKQTGKLRWRRELDSPIYAGALIMGDQVLAASKHCAYALSMTSGQIQWQSSLEGETKGDLVGSTSTLYLAVDQEDDEQDAMGSLYAVSMETGKHKWRYDLAAKIGVPLALDNQIAFGSSDRHIYVLNESDGTVNWKREMKGPIYEAATADGHRLYLVASDNLCALSLQTGETIWELATDGSGSCAPAVDNEKVYAAFDRKLYAVDKDNGILHWIFEADSPIGSISTWEGLVYLTSSVFSFMEAGEHHLLAVDQDTGQLYWRYQFSDSLYGAPTIDDGALYLGCRNHHVYAFNVNRADVGMVRAAEIWNQLGLLRQLRNETDEAIEAFQQCLALDPTFHDASQSLFAIFMDQGRIVRAIETQQDYISLLPSDEHEQASAALRRISGLKWTYETPSLFPMSLLPLPDSLEDAPDSSPIVPSPSVSSETLYLGAPDGSLHALSVATGQQQWRVVPKLPERGGSLLGKAWDRLQGSLPGDASTNSNEAYEEQRREARPIRSSVAVWRDRLYFGTADGCFYALRADNGTVLWAFRAGGRVDSTATIASGSVFFGCDDGMVYAISADRGKVVWKFQTLGQVKSSPVLANGVLYIGSYDGAVYAIDAQSGRERWRFQTGDIINSSPRFSNGVVFLGPDDNFVYALDAEDGTQKWQFRVEEGVRSILQYGLGSETGLTTFGFLPSTPVVHDGVVYVGSNGSSDCQVYAICAETGQLRWRFPVENGEVSSPVLYKGVLFVGSGGIQFHDEHLYGLNTRDGSLVWKFGTEGDVLSAPVIADDHLYCWSMGGRVYAFDVSNVPSYPSERDASFYLRAGEVSFKNEQIESAVQAFEAAKAINPTDPNALARLADCYQKLGKTDLQIQTLERCQELDPWASHTYWRLGEYYRTQGLTDKAIDQFQRYLGVLESRLDDSVLGFGHAALGRAYQAGEMTDEALREYDLAIEIGARFTSPRYGTDRDKQVAISGLLFAFAEKSKLLVQQGADLKEHLDLNLLQDASHLLDELPTEYFVTLSLFRRQQGAYQDAAMALETAAEMAPQDMSIKAHLGEAYQAMQAYEKAIKNYESMLSIDPENEHALSMLGTIYHDHTFQFERAYHYYLQIKQISPSDPAMSANLAEACLSAERFEEAHELARDVVANTEDWSLLLNAKFCACAASFLLGEEERAMAEFGEFTDFYDSVPPDFENFWNYAGTTRFITDQEDVLPHIKRILLLLLDLLQARLDRESLESSIPEELRR